MTHLPYILASYTAFMLVVFWLAVRSALRLRRARSRLRAIDPRSGQNAS